MKNDLEVDKGVQFANTAQHFEIFFMHISFGQGLGGGLTFSSESVIYDSKKHNIYFSAHCLVLCLSYVLTKELVMN